MEKKKILFISVIIGLFLFIAIALPLSLLSSKDNALAAVPPAVSGVPKPEETPADRPASMDVRDAIVNPSVESALSASPGGQNVVINNYDASGAVVSESRSALNEGETVTITVVPAAPAAQTPDATTQTPTPPVSSPAPAASQSGQSAQSVRSTAPSAQPKPPARPATKPAAQPAAQPPASSGKYNYWIQTGSFATKPRAENVQIALKDKGISSKIESAVVKGNSVYRVRTGPYTTHNEATYWLKLIKSIDMEGLDESWIDQVSK
ncbi:MAG: SPOR domain-containing protein [Treponema sp.]|jgi:cell division protein FtsN|nr:SPOR domain-containing protein [Treponema sp.]